MGAYGAVLPTVAGVQGHFYAGFNVRGLSEVRSLQLIYM